MHICKLLQILKLPKSQNDPQTTQNPYLRERLLNLRCLVT